MPHKANADRRHHSPRPKRQVTNGAEYDAALRQTEGLIGSILQRLGLDLPVPDHSTIGRRSRTVELPPRPRSSGGPLPLLVDSTGLKLGRLGEGLVEKHGTKRRRSWKRPDYCVHFTCP